MGSPRRAQRSGSSGGRRSKGAQRSFCRRQKRSRADFVTTKGRRFAPYKRFCRRRKPWRRANLLRPSILNNRVPIVCVGTQWEAGRRGRVSRHEGFLQPEVSIVPFCTAAQPGGCVFPAPSHSARGEIGNGRPSVPPLRMCLGLPHLIVGAHIMRPRAGITRPYGIPEPLAYSAGADDSAARLFTEDSPLPAGGASPSPTVSLKGPRYLAGVRHSLPTGGCVFLRRKSMFSLDNKLLQI